MSGPEAAQKPVRQHATCRFKDICLDTSAATADAMVAFWAAALALEPDRRSETVARLSGGRPEDTVWINTVAEPRTVKNRIHLDLDVARVGDLVDLGAEVVAAGDHEWTTLRDPDGGELDAFERAPGHLRTDRLYEVSVDANDPPAQASWWAALFGVDAHADPGDGTISLRPPGVGWSLVFAAVPEPKTVKNRVHLDLWGHTSQVLEAGARLVRARDDEIDWDVLADPEGNEFCVFGQD